MKFVETTELELIELVEEALYDNDNAVEKISETLRTRAETKHALELVMEDGQVFKLTIERM